MKVELEKKYRIKKPSSLFVSGVVDRAGQDYRSADGFLRWAPKAIREGIRETHEFKECRNLRIQSVEFKDYYIVYHPETDHLHIFTKDPNKPNPSKSEATRIANEFIIKCIEAGEAEEI